MKVDVEFINDIIAARIIIARCVFISQRWKLRASGKRNKQACKYL